MVYKRQVAPQQVGAGGVANFQQRALHLLGFFAQQFFPHRALFGAFGRAQFQVFRPLIQFGELRLWVALL